MPSLDTRPMQRPDLDGLLDRVFGPEPPKDRAGEGKFDDAFEAIRRGAATFAELRAQCRTLQDELAATAQHHRLELDEARLDLQRWQDAAQALSQRLTQSQEAAATHERLRVAQQQRAEAETVRADAAERRIESLERIASAFRDSLSDVLGVSPPVLSRQAA